MYPPREMVLRSVARRNVYGGDSCRLSRDDKLRGTPLAGRQWVSLQQEGFRYRVTE